MDISAAAKPGANALEVHVTGVWRNRLTGDAKYPDGFPGDGSAKAPLQFKPHLSTDIKVRPDETPPPSGLIGAGRLFSTQTRVLSDQRLERAGVKQSG